MIRVILIALLIAGCTTVRRGDMPASDWAKVTKEIRHGR